MSNDEIEAIVKDAIEFVEDEFSETTKGERSDLAKFLRERLVAQLVAQQSAERLGLQDGSQNGIYSDNPNDDEGDK